MMLEGLNVSIDVIVPRCGKSLVAEVERSAKVPVFGHLEGICHIYVDEYAEEKKAFLINSSLSIEFLNSFKNFKE